MKKIILILSTVLSLTASAIGKHQDTSTCLIVYGNAIINGNNVGDITAKLYCDNAEVNSQNISDDDDEFYFELSRNHFYTVKILKNGFVTRSVSINTALPAHVSTTPVFRFHFQVELLPESNNLNNEFADFPIAIVEYRAGRDVFDYSRKYTTKVKSNLRDDQDDFLSINDL